MEFDQGCEIPVPPVQPVEHIRQLIEIPGMHS